MTIKELSQLHWLNREIEQYEARLEELYTKATGITQNMTGMPHVSGVSDKVGKFVAEIAEQRDLLEDAKQRRVAECDALLQYINAIPDSVTRQIFMLRFYDGLSWGHVARRVGGNNTYGSVKQRVFRYIKSSPTVAT